MHRRSATTPLRGPRHLAATGALLVAAGAAEARCDRDWIAVDARRADDGSVLVVRNIGNYPVTVTLQARSSAGQVRGSRTHTGTLAPGETYPALQFPGRQPGGDIRRLYRCDWTVGDMHAEHADSQLYTLPYATGYSYRVLQGYGSRFSHTGREEFAVDFKMDEGTPVHAARDGVVARVVEEHSIGCWQDGCGRYANFIVVLHDDGTTGEYYHLQKDGAVVDEGQQVRAGQHIGYSGNTGHTTMPHLHFAVYRAIDRGRTQSIPVRFVSSDGIVSRPRRGGRYLAASVSQLRQAQAERERRHSD